MNDTHGVNGAGWYGFDLDGTLAEYNDWHGVGHIGRPVQPMVDLIKRMHDEGKVVKIVTARVAPKDGEEETYTNFAAENGAPLYAREALGDRIITDGEFYTKPRWGARDFVADWCLHYLGFLPEIVYQKDHLMLELYDDRVKQVVPNKGWLVEDIAKMRRKVDTRIIIERHVISAKWWDRLGFFLLGCMVSSLVMLFLLRITCSGVSLPEATQRLLDATAEFQQAALEQQMEGLLP